MPQINHRIIRTANKSAKLMVETEHNTREESIRLGLNEQTFTDYIDQMASEEKMDTISIAWVKWMLAELSLANMNDVRINPDWLRATLRPMNEKNPEPHMFIK